MTLTIHPFVGDDEEEEELYQHPLEFDTQAAPFGIEWTSPVTAQVVVPDGSPFLCGEMNTTTIASSRASFQAHQYPLAYLVEEGECSWEEKALNVKELEGDYMILYSGSSTGFPSGHPSVTQPLWDYAPEIEPPVGALGISRDAGLAIREELLQARATTANATVVATLQEDYGNVFANPLNVEAHVTTMQVSASLSFFGSAWIVSGLLQKKKRLQAKTPTLFLLFLSLGDCIASLCIFLGPWAIPQVVNFGQLSTEIWHTYFPLASGTAATCAAQGFFYQFAASLTCACTGFLALQNLLIVKHNWSNERIRKLERVALIGAVVTTLGMAIACAAMDVFNPSPYNFCYITQYPMMCETPQEGARGILGTWCAKYSTSTKDNIARFFFAVLWISGFLVLIWVCMGLIFCYVRKQERIVEHWSENAREGRAQKHVLWKAMCYVGAFLVVNGVGTLAMFHGEPWVKFLMALVFPMQGLLNALIYSNALDRLFGCQPRREVTSAPASSLAMCAEEAQMDQCAVRDPLMYHRTVWHGTEGCEGGSVPSCRLGLLWIQGTMTVMLLLLRQQLPRQTQSTPRRRKGPRKRRVKRRRRRQRASSRPSSSSGSRYQVHSRLGPRPRMKTARRRMALASAPPSDFETWRAGVEPLERSSKNLSATTTQIEAMGEGSGIGAIKATDQSQTGNNSLDSATAILRAVDEILEQEDQSSDGRDGNDDDGNDDDGLAHLAALTRGLSIPYCAEDDSLHFSDPSESEQQLDSSCSGENPCVLDRGESTQEHNGDSKVADGPCTSCGKAIQSAWKFCPHCGHSRDCSSCGNPLQPEWTFCPHCGKGR